MRTVGSIAPQSMRSQNLPKTATEHTGGETPAYTGQHRVPPCFKTQLTKSGRGRARRHRVICGTRVSVGRTNYLLISLHFKRICPTQAGTKPRESVVSMVCGESAAYLYLSRSNRNAVSGPASLWGMPSAFSATSQYETM